jgi:superoxide reductase
MSREFYRCEKCGAIVEVLKEGNEIICCGEPMQKIVPNSEDAALEKHVPIIEYTDSGVTIKVGSVPHPMEEAHYIEWIEVFYDSRRERKYLKPGDQPEASFSVAAKDVEALIYCNLQGLWTSG